MDSGFNSFANTDGPNANKLSIGIELFNAALKKSLLVVSLLFIFSNNYVDLILWQYHR